MEWLRTAEKRSKLPKTVASVDKTESNSQKNVSERMKMMKNATRKTFSVFLLTMFAVLFGCIFFVLPAWANAEGVTADPTPAVLFDLTDVLIAVVLAVGGFVWRKWVRPWLESKQLMDEAKIVVNAVEALLGRGNGAEKWKLAVEKMEAYGFNVDADIVLDALRTAWRNMNTEQLAAGEKEKPPEA